MAVNISCVVDLLLGTLKIYLSLLPIFIGGNFSVSKFQVASVCSLRSTSCDAWHLPLICWLICWYGFKEGGRSSCDLASKVSYSYQLHLYPNLERTISFMCATNAHHSVANWLLVFHSLLPPSYLTSSTPSFPLPLSHMSSMFRAKNVTANSYLTTHNIP